MHGIGQAALRRGRGGQAVDIGEGHGAVRVFHGLRVRVALRQRRGRFGGRIYGRDFPLRIADGHAVAHVVINRRAPEIGARNRAQHLASAVAVGDQTARQVAEEHLEVFPLHARIALAAHNPKRRMARCCPFRAGHLVHALRKGHLMPARRPRGRLLLAEGERHGVLARARLRREGQRVLAAFRRRHVGCQLGPRDLHAVARQRRNARKGGGGRKHAAVGDNRPVRIHLRCNILVIVANFLHFWTFFAVAVDDAVAAEVVVRRPVVKVAAVGVGGQTVTVFGANALVNEVPDKPALIQGLFIGVFGVFVHGAVRVAHRMRVLAQDERPAAVFGKEPAQLGDRRVHLAFDVGGVIAPAVAGDALVVHQARVVETAEQRAHLIDNLAAEGFVAAAPDEHAGMVLVALIGGCHTVEQYGEPLHAIAGQRVRKGPASAHDGIPCAVRFHVVFVNDVQPQLVAQGVQGAVVGIMAGPHGVDVVAFHGQQVAPNHVRRHRAPRLRAEIMTVHAFEHDAPAVELHDAVPQLEAPEAHALAHDLALHACLVGGGDEQVVQVRRFAAPQLGRGYRQAEADGLLRGLLGRGDDARPVRQRQAHRAGSGRRREQHAQPHVEHGVGIVVVQKRFDAHVLDMRLARRIEPYVAVEAGKAQEVLIFQPAAGAEAIDAAGQLVQTVAQVRRQLKCVRGEGIGREAHILPVEPERNAALRAVKGDEDPLAAHRLGQEKRPHIAAHRVEPLGNFADFHVLASVPGVLHVGVLRRAVALHLHVRGHGDVRPIAAIEIDGFKAGNHLAGVARIMKFPQAVQRVAQAALAGGELLHAGVGHMVRMGCQTVLRKIRGIFQKLFVKMHRGMMPRAARPLLSSSGSSYLTAPATALVKLFCRRKKMTIVGSEQMVTPAITTPKSMT